MSLSSPIWRKRRGHADYFLSSFAGASGAYALTRLTQYATSVARVRRSTDNAESDFSAVQVTNGAMLGFVVPTAVQALYGEAMYFDGTNDAVEIATGSADKIFFANKVITAAWVCVDHASTRVIHSFSVSASRLYIANTGVLFVNATSTGVTIEKGRLYVSELTNNANGDAIQLKLDGAVVWSGTATATVDTGEKFTVGSRYVTTTNGLFFNGVIYNVTISDYLSWVGDGNTDAAWLDQIGSNNGTVVGSPALFTGQGFNGYVTTWYDQRVPTSKDVAIPNIVNANSYATGANTLGSLWEKRVKFKFTHKYSISGTKGQFGATDSDGYRYDIYFLTNSRMRIFNPNTALGSPNSYWEINTTTLVSGQEYEVDVTFGADGAKPTSFLLNGVSQTIPDSATSNAAASADIDLFYVETIGATVGSTSSNGQNPIYDIQVFDDDGTTLLREWNLRGNKQSDFNDNLGVDNLTPANPFRRMSLVNTSVSNDMVQATAASQPIIVTNGAYELLNASISPRFDGVNDFLETPNVDFKPTTAFTLIAVVKNDLANISSNSYIAGIYDSNNSRSFGLLYGTNERLTAFFGDASTGAFLGSYLADNTITTDSPHIVALTYSAGTVKMFIDGVLVTGAGGSGSIPTSIFQSTTPFSIGGVFATYPTTDSRWQGEIPAVIPYLTALPDDEIIAAMNTLNAQLGIY